MKAVNCSVGSFIPDVCKGKEWKVVLKEWLNLLKLMRNLKSFYRSQFLKDVLQNRLVQNWMMIIIVLFNLVMVLVNCFILLC